MPGRYLSRVERRQQRAGSTERDRQVRDDDQDEIAAGGDLRIAAVLRLGHPDGRRSPSNRLVTCGIHVATRFGHGFFCLLSKVTGCNRSTALVSDWFPAELLEIDTALCTRQGRLPGFPEKIWKFLEHLIESMARDFCPG